MHMKFLVLLLSVVSTFTLAQTNVPVSSSVRPLVYANFDPQIQSVNLTPNSDKSACPMIDVDQYRDGFRTSKILPYTAHLGAAIGWWFPVAGQWLSVGFGLTKEGYIEFFYNSETEEDLKDDRKRKIPNKVSEIKSWKKGDAIYFDSLGGALITVGTGVPPFMTGVTAHVKAGWSHYIEKTNDDNTVFITVRRRKIGEYRFGNGVSELGAAIGLAKENSKSVAYQMKLEKEDVKEAYELMMRGDFRKAQQLSLQEREDIQKLDDITWKSQNRFGFVGVGVPYFPIFAIGATTQRQEQQVDRVTTWDATDDIDEGLFQSERFIRLAIGHRTLRKQFKAQRKQSSFLDWDNGGVRVTKTEYSGLFQYEYQSDMTGERDLSRIVKKLQKKTLLEDELCIQIPKIEKRTKFRKVLLKMKLSDHFMRKLMSEGASSKLKDFAQLHFEGKDLKKLNKNIKHISKKIEKAANYFEKDNKKFSKAISLVGKKIWNRSRLFNLLYKVGKTCGMTFQYEVSGRRLSRHTIDKTYEVTENCPLN